MEVGEHGGGGGRMKMRRQPFNFCGVVILFFCFLLVFFAICN